MKGLKPFSVVRILQIGFPVEQPPSSGPTTKFLLQNIIKNILGYHYEKYYLPKF